MTDRDNFLFPKNLIEEAIAKVEAVYPKQYVSHTSPSHNNKYEVILIHKESGKIYNLQKNIMVGSTPWWNQIHNLPYWFAQFQIPEDDYNQEDIETAIAFIHEKA